MMAALLPRIVAGLVLAGPVTLVTGPAPLAAPAGVAVDLCRAATTREETRATMPDNLLTAISLVESGRWDKARQARVAWPWTVMAEGRGRYLPSKQAAIAEVKQLQARGVRNIDVGCMQVNLHWHGDAFGSLEEALDPAANAAYAARFLTELHMETGDWDVAAAWYHSRTPERADYYSGKVQVALAELEGSPAGGGSGLDAAPARPDPVRLRVLAIRKQIEERRQELAEERERARRITEARRATAKAFAEDWRRRKMEEYLHKEAEEAVDAILQRL
ncbi:murein transglycosylase [Caenispirillum salinarum]|uniref:murein transglycosylase n=1 Tax=Caenispirillum salinarum TaxID=859058 RepID=UPI00384C25D0